MPPGIRGLTVQAEVTIVELMGHEVIIYCRLPSGKEFIARLDPRAKPAVGDRLDLLFDVSRIHLFDKDSEQAI